MEERLQKILSSAGVCSRRASEGLIQGGRVTVNGKVAQLGDRADLTCDTVAVDGTPLHKPEKCTYIMLHKPRGYITTLSDEQGRRTVADLVADCGTRLWPVGRLDFQSEGLLLMTDDGALTQALIHPSHQVEKEYLVTVEGDVNQAIPILTGPITLDGVPLTPAVIRQFRNFSGKKMLSITIREGKNRQIRRMCELAGLRVTRLKRIREGKVVLDPTLAVGKWRPLTAEEVEILQKPVEIAR